MPRYDVWSVYPNFVFLLLMPNILQLLKHLFISGLLDREKQRLFNFIRVGLNLACGSIDRFVSLCFQASDGVWWATHPSWLQIPLWFHLQNISINYSLSQTHESYTVALTFEPVEVWPFLNGSYWAALYCGAVYCAVQCSSNVTFESVNNILTCVHSD